MPRCPMVSKGEEHMPHDRNGVELKAGDRVIIECLVEEVTPVETYCNLRLIPVYPANPPEMKTVIGAINAAVTEKIDHPVQ